MTEEMEVMEPMRDGEYAVLDLVAKLKRQRDENVDLLVATSGLSAEAMPPMGDGGPEDLGSLCLAFPDETGQSTIMPMTDWATGQLADKMGVPRNYFQRMLKAGKLPLAADNVNAWIEEREKRMIRTQAGVVRAVLSDRYKPIDNYPLLFKAMEVFKGKQATFERCELTNTRMFIRAIVPHDPLEIAENDLVVPGVILGNSEVGNGRFWVAPFLKRLVCANGLISNVEYSRIHLGEKHRDLGRIWSHDTNVREAALFWSQVTDLLEAAFDPEYIGRWVDWLKGTARVPVGSPTTAVYYAMKECGIEESRQAELLDYFTTSESRTQWGLVNTMTWAAHAEGPDRRVGVERFAGTLAGMGADEFQRRIAA